MSWYAGHKNEKKKTEHIAYVTSGREAYLYAIYCHHKTGSDVDMEDAHHGLRKEEYNFDLRKFVKMSTEELKDYLENECDTVKDTSLGTDGTRNWGVKRLGTDEVLSTEDLFEEMQSSWD